MSNKKLYQNKTNWTRALQNQLTQLKVVEGKKSSKGKYTLNNIQ